MRQVSAIGATGLDDHERTLWQRFREGADAAARDDLLARHLPYARILAATYFARRQHNSVEFDDYLQLARIGLLEAFERFDPTVGVQFRTFAARRMQGAILDGLSKLTERHQQITARQRVLAERTGSLLRNMRTRAVSVDAPGDSASPAPLAGGLLQYLADVGMGLAIGFMLEGTGLIQAGDGLTTGSGTGVDTVYQTMALKHTRERLRGLIDALPPTERTVIRSHYLQGLPFDEIAGTLALSKGRISQLHKQGLATLRSLIASRAALDLSL